MNVEINKQQLRAILVKNKEKHVEDYKNMVVEWHKKATDWVAKIATTLTVDKAAKAIKPRHLSLEAPVPTFHGDQYDQAIEMLDLHVGNTIVLENREYKNLVNDEWQFSHMFNATKASYDIR